MTGEATAVDQPAVPAPDRGPVPDRPARRPGLLVFLASFASLLLLLLIRNPDVFTLRVAERGDSAANALIIDQAKHFHLLVGNYSRIGFSHPGPAFFYVQAFGEWLGYDVLGALPSPYSGQWLAIIVLNCALVGAVLTILWSWSRSLRALLWCGAAILLFAGGHDQVFTSTWMPYVYVAPFLLLLVAAASVAAGRTRHLWLLALPGGLLVHGHAEFLLLFVPVLGGGALAILVFRRVRRGQPIGTRSDWLAAALVVAVFLLPMVLNVVLHWPGEYGKYLTYGGKHASSHGIGAELRYLLWFWAPRPLLAALLIVGLAGLALLGARRTPEADLRRFVTCGALAAALATLLFAAYIVRGIDYLQSYIGYFFWAAPLALALVILVGLDSTLAGAGKSRWATARLVAPLVAVAAALVLVVRSGAVVTTPEQLAEAPQVIQAVAGYTGGRPALLSLDHDSWPDMTALLIAGRRAGQRVCVVDPGWRFMVTSQYVCDAGDRATGLPVRMAPKPGDPATILVTFGGQVLPIPANPT